VEADFPRNARRLQATVTEGDVMKFASVLIDGKPGFGAFTEAGFIDLRPYFGSRCTDLRQFLAEDLLDETEKILASAPVMQSPIVFDRLIPNLDARMFALGWSYKDHQIETGKDAPKHPFLFSKLPRSMVGNEQPIEKPRMSDRFDFEGEIVIVIGKPGRHIAADEAMAHVAGYSILMDGSIRDWQQHSPTAGKNFDRSSSYGPYLVTKDDIGDPANMELVTRLNGVEMQRSSFALMVWKIEELVSYVSAFCRLEVGDSISTGTPGGVGHRRSPPIFMNAGDTISVEVRGIGSLTNTVIEEL
jgi:2-keto-4-pentenoate hydratase/2-oxohepta-3-ene-1,7-dioic acid hydratase in catechol pathway